jgi:hypothetical protein
MSTPSRAPSQRQDELDRPLRPSSGSCDACGEVCALRPRRAHPDSGRRPGRLQTPNTQHLSVARMSGLRLHRSPVLAEDSTARKVAFGSSTVAGRVSMNQRKECPDHISAERIECDRFCGYQLAPRPEQARFQGHQPIRTRAPAHTWCFLSLARIKIGRTPPGKRVSPYEYVPRGDRGDHEAGLLAWSNWVVAARAPSGVQSFPLKRLVGHRPRLERRRFGRVSHIRLGRIIRATLRAARATAIGQGSSVPGRTSGLTINEISRRAAGGSYEYLGPTAHTSSAG